MKKLILAGGGDEKESRLLDELLVKLVGNEKILYIPIAWNGEGDFDNCYDWFSKTFGNLGFKNIKMWTDLNEKKYEDLEDFGAIYIGGGNTYKLLKLIKDSGFFDLLKKFIESGRIVYGGSAGAIILGHNIETSTLGGDPDENLVGLEDLSGLNEIGNNIVNCHYRNSQDEELKKYSLKNPGLNIISISEKSGLYVEDNKIKNLGTESAFVFSKGGKTEVKVGELIGGEDE